MTNFPPQDVEAGYQAAQRAFAKMRSESTFSLAAQAVLDTVCDNTEPDCDTQHLIAAALRAAADQVAPLSTNRRQDDIRQKLLAIAAELEGAND
jgi:hypothetical protein